MKSKASCKECVIVDFVKNNRFIFLLGLGALLYCCICAYFKSSPAYNVSAELQPWGDLLYNIAISVIAAVFFYIAQVYIPDRKRNRVLRDVTKKFCKSVLLKECNALKVRIDSIRSGFVTEVEIMVAMDANCQRVNSAINKALESYLPVLPEDLISAINDLRSDDMLYQITIRSSGSLKNRSLDRIVMEDLQYNCLINRIDRIKSEVEKM